MLLRASGVLAGLCILLTAAQARLVVPREAQGDPTPILARIEAAVLAGDHRTLADLVSPDGVSLSLGPVADRTSVLTPSQAFYYFKSLFQNRQTEAFVFEKRQEADGGRLHALATWTFAAPDSGAGQRQRVLFTLEQTTDGWKVVEITAWR